MVPMPLLALYDPQPPQSLDTYVEATMLDSSEGKHLEERRKNVDGSSAIS